MLDVIHQLNHEYDIVQYGELRYGNDVYPLMAAKSKEWDDNLPIALVTGGVHGYETSGVLGALRFLTEYKNAYVGRLNLLVVPCVSPWAYEHVARWNYEAIDTNRQFFTEGKAEESRSLMAFVEPWQGRFWCTLTCTKQRTRTKANSAPRWPPEMAGSMCQTRSPMVSIW